MKTLLMKKATTCVAISSLVAGLFVSSVTSAMPSQGGLIASSKPASETELHVRSETHKLIKPPVGSQPAPDKTEITSATGKSPKAEDKKTIGRCWKRLMTMVRELNHAHTSKGK